MEVTGEEIHHQDTKTTKNCKSTGFLFSWCLLGIRDSDTRDKGAFGVLVVISAMWMG
jgi:hypothetical protein